MAGRGVCWQLPAGTRRCASIEVTRSLHIVVRSHKQLHTMQLTATAFSTYPVCGRGGREGWPVDSCRRACSKAISMLQAVAAATDTHLHGQHPVTMPFLHSLGLARRCVQAPRAAPPAAAGSRRWLDRLCRCAWMIASALAQRCARHKGPARRLCGTIAVCLPRWGSLGRQGRCHHRIKGYRSPIAAPQGAVQLWEGGGGALPLGAPCCRAGWRGPESRRNHVHINPQRSPYRWRQRRRPADALCASAECRRALHQHQRGQARSHG